MCGKEYDLIRRKRWQNTRPHSVQKKNRALSTGGFGVYLFFFMAPEGDMEKGKMFHCGGRTFVEEGVHIPRYYHYPLFIKETGGL